MACSHLLMQQRLTTKPMSALHVKSTLSNLLIVRTCL